jgi:tetratricopeptide (TPR) repeat protein
VLARDAWAAYERLDAEGCAACDPPPPPPRRGRGAFARLLLLATLGAAGAGGVVGMAGQPGDTLTVLERPRAERLESDGEASAAARAFVRGVRAYDAERWPEARAAFETAADAAPRAADAWANLGTTAWVQGDTVAAAVGWQRALRLTPTAGDVRDRLALLPTSQDGGVAGLPPVPVNVVAVAGALLWLLAGGALAVRVRGRGGRRLTSVAWPAGATAAVLLGAGLYLTDLARAEDLAVVRRDGALRSEPALGAEAAGQVQASDLARIVGRQHAWVRVVLDGDREGWVESDRLVSLAALTAP